MSKGRRNSATAGTTPLPPPAPARRGSTPSLFQLPPPTQQSSASGPAKRRLSLPHNAYDKLASLSAPQTLLALDPLPPAPPVPLKLVQYKLCPLIEIVEEEIEQHAKEFELHKIHEATAKMHISNLIV